MELCVGRTRRGRARAVWDVCGLSWVTRNRSVPDRRPVWAGLDKVGRLDWPCCSDLGGAVLSRAVSGNPAGRRLAAPGPSSAGAIGGQTAAQTTRAIQRSPAKIQRPTSTLRRLRQSIRDGLQRNSTTSYTLSDAGSQWRKRQERRKLYAGRAPDLHRRICRTSSGTSRRGAFRLTLFAPFGSVPTILPR